jgi:hypothetical protein
MWSCWDRPRLEGQTCGIPHLAKNKRDVGHPAFVKRIESKGGVEVEKIAKCL